MNLQESQALIQELKVIVKSIEQLEIELGLQHKSQFQRAKGVGKHLWDLKHSKKEHKLSMGEIYSQLGIHRNTGALYMRLFKSEERVLEMGWDNLPLKSIDRLLARDGKEDDDTGKMFKVELDEEAYYAFVQWAKENGVPHKRIG